MLKRLSFNANVLRYIAIIAMTLDHIAWYFLPFTSLPAQLMHFAGRMTAPMMCFFLVQGFLHTSDLKKYTGRMVIFACISQVPFILLKQHEFNMIFTLTMGLICLVVIASDSKIWIKAIEICSILIVSWWCDWKVWGIVWVLSFYIFRNNKLKQFISFCLIWFTYYIYALNRNFTSYHMTNPGKALIYSLYSLGCIPAAFMVIYMYNGRRKKNAFSKWFFYIYYPLHLIIICLVNKYLMMSTG